MVGSSGCSTLWAPQIQRNYDRMLLPTTQLMRLSRAFKKYDRNMKGYTAKSCCSHLTHQLSQNEYLIRAQGNINKIELVCLSFELRFKLIVNLKTIWYFVIIFFLNVWFFIVCLSFLPYAPFDVDNLKLYQLYYNKISFNKQHNLLHKLNKIEQ